jgi:hypothetical protein
VEYIYHSIKTLVPHWVGWLLHLFTHNSFAEQVGHEMDVRVTQTLFVVLPLKQNTKTLQKITQTTRSQYKCKSHTKRNEGAPKGRGHTLAWADACVATHHTRSPRLAMVVRIDPNPTRGSFGSEREIEKKTHLRTKEISLIFSPSFSSPSTHTPPTSRIFKLSGISPLNQPEIMRIAHK